MSSRAVFIAAWVLLSSVFVGLGLERVLTAAGVIDPGIAVTGAGALAFGVVELIAGLMILIGWQVRWVALALAAFLLVDAFIAHPFWQYAAPEQHGQLLHFLKNVSMIGGLLLLFLGGAHAKGRHNGPFKELRLISPGRNDMPPSLEEVGFPRFA